MIVERSRNQLNGADNVVHVFHKSDAETVALFSEPDPTNIVVDKRTGGVGSYPSVSQRRDDQRTS